MNQPIYLDYAATAPVDQSVADKMWHYLTMDGSFGNPASTTHRYGAGAAHAITQAALQVAQLINAQPQEIIWTSGATESNNLAIKGVAEFYRHKGKHIITAKTEHKSVLDCCRWLEKQGFEVTYLAPLRSGLINAEDIGAAIRSDTILVSLMHVNNETGVIQDIAAIGRLIKQHNCLFHVDAAQGIGKLSIDVTAVPIDLLSLSGHKVYGPKGIGALYVRQRPPVKLAAQMQGGGHQHGFRAGTLATHQIVGLGEACALAQTRLASELQQIIKLRNSLLKLLAEIPDIEIITPIANAVPHILNVSFKGIHSEALLYALRDIAALSSGSACDSALMEPSYVLKAMGRDPLTSRGAIRISIGRYTSPAMLNVFGKHLQAQVARLRSISPIGECYGL